MSKTGESPRMEAPAAIWTVEVGFLLWGQMRDLLEQIRFQGYRIEWREGRGWLSRDFTIKADPRVIRILQASIPAD